jgi:hypothetical protein
MATIKQLPTSPRTKVFRAICSILKQDPVLSSAIRPESMRFWSGAPHDTMEFSFSSAPAIRLTPAGTGEVFRFPSARTGDLLINVDCVIAGTDADDQMNLWWAIERAIYPDNFVLQQANVVALQQAGAYPGLVEFSQPLFDPAPQDRFWVCTGQMKVQVLLQLQG